jgi:hypothetical protein
MSLGVTVGILSELSEADPEGVDYYRGIFAAVNELLAENGLPAHQEPESLPALSNRCSVGSYPYGFLHHLRRAYAHRLLDDTFVAAQSQPGEDCSDDPAVQQQVEDMASHLICHSDAEGFYLPMDFEPVLFDDTERVPGSMVGSSYRLLEELVFVAPALGITLQDGRLSDDEADAINQDSESETGPWIERLVWLSLYEAARLSIEHRAAICFS